MFRLDNKTCIVTGAGSKEYGVGTGQATSVVFARAGANVVLVDRDAEQVANTQKMIEAEGGRCAVFLGDLTDPATADAMVAFAKDTFGTLDVLHNNLGSLIKGPITALSEDEWDRALTMNLRTTISASRAAMQAMETTGGVVTTTSSVASIRPRGSTAYSTAKGAVNALTQALAMDGAPYGIRVNCILPGPIYTPMGMYASGKDDEARERRKNASPMKREGTAWDIAHAGLYLASDEARYVTGVLLPVDGGMTLPTAPR